MQIHNRYIIKLLILFLFISNAKYSIVPRIAQVENKKNKIYFENQNNML